MIRPCYLACALLIPLSTLAADDPTQAETDRQQASQLVQRALVAELEGDEETRRQLLQEAVRTSDDFAPAHWQLGRVKGTDGFESVADSIATAQDSKDLKTYRKLRDEALGDPQAEERLARIAARLGLAEQSRLFYFRVLTNPQAGQKSRRGALIKLGLKPAYGTYMTPGRIREVEATRKKQREVFERWMKKVQAWQRSAMGRKSALAHAIRQIGEVDDAGIVLAADAVAAHLHPQLAAPMVEVLSEFPELEATQAITRYAILSSLPTARQTAADELARRRLHDYVPLLIQALVAPIESRWQVTSDGDGNILYHHQLSQDNQRERVVLDLQHIDLIVRGRDARFDGPQRVDENDRRAVSVTSREEQNSPEEQEERIKALARAREARVKRFNERAKLQNQRATAVLEAVTDQRNLGVGEWRDWWLSYNESYVPRPTRRMYRRTATPYLNLMTDVYTRHSCFVAGTPVWTDQGLQPIESIQVGDRVLSQNVDTGELSWKLVLRTTAGESASTGIAHFRIDDESIFPTLGHVVWVNGTGWKIAKRVRDGDRVRSLSGPITLQRLNDERVPETVYNLVVAETNTYFVGKRGILVHDITPRQSTRTLVPGLPASE